MTKSHIALYCCAVLSSAAYGADEINLECEQLAHTLIERFSGEGLLATGTDSTMRAQSIAQDVCAGTQAQAQQQHEAGKKEALSNWLFESTGGKPGNKRLLNLKR